LQKQSSSENQSISFIEFNLLITHSSSPTPSMRSNHQNWKPNLLKHHSSNKRNKPNYELQTSKQSKQRTPTKKNSTIQQKTRIIKNHESWSGPFWQGLPGPRSVRRSCAGHLGAELSCQAPCPAPHCRCSRTLSLGLSESSRSWTPSSAPALWSDSSFHSSVGSECAHTPSLLEHPIL